MNPSLGHHVAQLSAPPLGHVPPPPPLGHVPPPAPQLPPPAGHHPHPSPPQPGLVRAEVSPVVTVGVSPVLPQKDESPTRPVSSHQTTVSEPRDSAQLEEGGEVMTVKQPTPLLHTQAATTIPTSPAAGSLPGKREEGEPVSTSKGTEEQKKPVKISFSGGKRSSGGGPPAGTAPSAKLHVVSQQNEPALKKQKSDSGVPRAVAKAFADESDEEEEEMPREARLRMRNLGKDTPTSCGPNSFNKTSKGFVDIRGVWRKSN